MTACHGQPERRFVYADARSESWGWWAGAAFFLLLAGGGVYQAATGDRPLERWGFIGPPDEPIVPPLLGIASLVCGGMAVVCLRQGVKAVRLPRLEIVLTPEGIYAPRTIDAAATEFVAFAEIRSIVSVSDEQAGLMALRLETTKGPFLIVRRKLEPAAFDTIEGVLLSRTTGLAPTAEPLQEAAPALPPPCREEGAAALQVYANKGFWIALGFFPAVWLVFCVVVLVVAWRNGRIGEFRDWKPIVGLLALPIGFIATCWFLVPYRRWHRLEVWPTGLRLIYLVPRYRVRWVLYRDIRRLAIVTRTSQVGENTREARILYAYLPNEEVVELAAGKRADLLEEVIRRAVAQHQLAGEPFAAASEKPSDDIRTTTG